MDILRKWVRTFPLLGRFARAVRSALVVTAAPNGHFYSPVVNPRTIEKLEDTVWPDGPTTLPGIDFNDASHQRILADWFPRHIAKYTYPQEPVPGAPATDYFSLNGQFGWLDSRALLVFLCELRPAHVVEIGSGYSSLLIADVNRRLLRERIDFRCIDPYPRPFLSSGLPGLAELIERPVQSLPPEFFDRLQGNDILFIDSSHVCKTASDVHYLFSQVLPRLKEGVFVHLHDIYLPDEYPKLWVLTENRSWNEQYVLQAVLANSDRFEIVFGSHYSQEQHPESLAGALGTEKSGTFGGGSFWIRRM